MKSANIFLIKALLSTFLPLSISYSTTTHAGFEQQCSPSESLDSASIYDPCNNLPVLIPGNDNHTNMYLLLSDLGVATIQSPKPDSNLWDAVYGNVPFPVDSLTAENKILNQRAFNPSDVSNYEERCSTIEISKETFTQQVNSNKNISTIEKQVLINERNKLSDCSIKTALLNIDPNWSVTARQYASYLNASISFYNANFSTANKIYAVLSNVDDAWLKETSQYMQIRSVLNSAYATGMNQYGDVDLDKINKNLLKQFLDNITTYLKLYPNGQYVASARGFMRRGFWLTGRQDLFVNEIVWQLNNPKSKYYNIEINNLPAEIDRRIFSSQYFDVKNLKDPFFLATYDLMQMREKSDKDFHPLTWNQLNAQKDYFKSQPELFKYLQAVQLFYVQKKPQEASSYLTDSSHANPYLQFSQSFLKGQILETINKTQAEQYWAQQLSKAKNSNQRGLFETALANHLNSKQDITPFLSKNPQISQLNLQKHFIVYKANEASLQKFIQSNQSTIDQKQAAIFILLNKALNHQNYTLFNQSYTYLPHNFTQYKGYESIEKLKNKPPFADFIWSGITITPQLKCANLITLTQQLEKSPKDPLFNICIGEYIRAPKAYYSNDWSGDVDHSGFKGAVFTRGQVYKDIIKNGPKGEIQAYALYRAIMCYSPSGNNDCSDKDVSKSVRKQWFDQIKQDYPNTNLAKSLKYYW